MSESRKTGPERQLLERAVHDLKNPLAVVRASLEWLEVELAGRDDALDAIHDATAASDRLVTIIDDLDALARLGLEGAPYGDTLPVARLLRAVVASVSKRLTAREITAEIVDTADVAIRGDERLLLRALGAFVDSTVRGAPHGGCIELVGASTTSASGLAQCEIRITVAGAVDVGTGEGSIDALDSSGIGVYLALRVVEAYGGTLHVVPTTSVCRMIVRLPA